MPPSDATAAPAADPSGLMWSVWESLAPAAQSTVAVTVAAVTAVGAVVLIVLGARAIGAQTRRAVALLWGRWNGRPRTPGDTSTADMLHDIAAPAAMGLVILVLAFEGLVEFAETMAGIPVPLSWLVIVVIEFLALWFASTRFRRAQAGHSAPVAAVMTWSVITLAAYLQHGHAVDAELSTEGVVFRTSLPFLLGILVETSLHQRRKNAADSLKDRRKRNVESVLKFNPVEYVQVRMTMAAHPEWSTEKALVSVRVNRASAVLMELRETAALPAAPMPEAPQSHDKDSVRAHRAERERVRRANADRVAKMDRLQKRAIRHLSRVGFGGDPSGDQSVDLLRTMQVRTRVTEVAGLDYSQRDTTLSVLHTLVTRADADTRPGTPELTEAGTPVTSAPEAGTPAAGAAPGVTGPGTLPEVTAPAPEVTASGAAPAGYPHGTPAPAEAGTPAPA
ncbi:hypothetical protein SAMN05421803_1527, partial [Nocardiopsis flavescens]